MTVRSLTKTPATRPNLDHALATAPAHLHPIIRAVRDHAVDMLFVPQGPGSFQLPAGKKRPIIFMIGDDFDRATGPDGFHLPSIRRIIRAAHCFAVVSSAPQSDVYNGMAVAAVATRHNTMIIETRPEQEIAWLALIQKLAPGRFIWLATVKGGRA